MTGGTETEPRPVDKALILHNEILDSQEDTNSEPFQDKVKKGILMLEDATRLVSVLDIFSRNENYAELPTEHLQFFMLLFTFLTTSDLMSYLHLRNHLRVRTFGWLFLHCRIRKELPILV